MIGEVARSLDALKPEQYILGFLFLCTYAGALGRLLELRGRLAAAGLAAFSAAGFVVRCDAWEPGVMLVALTLVGMGAFSAGAWVFWTIAHWRRGPAPMAESLDFTDEPALPGGVRARAATALRPAAHSG